MKRICYVIALLVLSIPVFIMGCSSTQNQVAQTRQIVDVAGRTVTIPANPHAAATMHGPTYEMVFAMGGKDQIGVVREDHKTTYPLANLTNPDLASYKSIDGVGPNTPVNIEEFLKLSPDLVLYWNLPDELKKFEDAGIPAAVIYWSAQRPTTVDGYVADEENKLKVLTDILGGDTAKKYQEWSKLFEEKVAFIQDRVSKIPQDQWPTVYVGNSQNDDILSTWGQNVVWDNYFDAEVCGGKWVGLNGPGQFPTVTKEQLLAWAPQVILVDNHGHDPDGVVQQLKTDPDYASLPAVQSSQIYRIPAGVFFMDKGTSKVVYLEWLAQKLHPELFTDVDIVKELKSYYKEFYNYSLSDDEAQKALAGWLAD
jgi:iron complex transport system substrate-binding protein